MDAPSLDRPLSPAPPPAAAGEPRATAGAPRFVEVVVDVPIRRAFGPTSPPPPEGTPQADAHALGGGPAHLQTFHYHLPPELLSVVEPGHLVWVPFGPRHVQGIVVRRVDAAPVATRAVHRLARPRPVLLPVQIELAFWIADYYVAPLAQAVRLFLPPGLLQRRPDRPGVRAKHEELVELLVPPEAIPQALGRLGRESQAARVLALLLERPTERIPREALRGLGVRGTGPLRRLAEAGWIGWDRTAVWLTTSPEAAEAGLRALRGTDRYMPVLRALAQAGRPLWKRELYAQVATDRATLRRLEQAGLIRVRTQVRYRDPLAGRAYPTTEPPVLTAQQERVWQAIQDTAFGQERILPARFLLHGVTGSGKTEIYLRAIQAALERGRQALVLVPEIALTPQTVARFAGRFPGRVTVVHSEMSPGERYDVWRRIRDGQVDVVVGPRSALFSPLPRLGLIVVDEEHEAAYKQDAEAWGSYTVFYDARTVAQELAQRTGSLLILGSATPSLEAYHRAQQGEIVLLEMPERVAGHGHRQADGPPAAYTELPPVEIVDMRQELRAGNRSIFSRSLQAELHATLDAGEQAILFLNRRGSRTFVMCRDCGHVERCPGCQVPLTYHEGAQRLICHHCSRRFPIPQMCPECGGRRIRYFGTGTQRIQELVRQIAPRARILRWDRDVTGRKGSHEAILERFAAHQADVLIGTQMIAKGLDLPLVTLVGVVSADVGLYLPDFRAAERTFQLLTQVAGRAGRSARGGRVIFQTYTPEHYAIRAAAEHDYHAFYQREMAFRREQGYPPVRRLARLLLWERHPKKAQEKAQQMAAALRSRAKALDQDPAEVLGPAPAFFARYQGYYRWQILVRAPDPARLLRGMDIPFGWRVDVDPMSVL